MNVGHNDVLCTTNPNRKTRSFNTNIRTCAPKLDHKYVFRIYQLRITNEAHANKKEFNSPIILMSREITQILSPPK